MSREAAAVVITTTTPTRAEAEIIARALVERRLAACAQIVGQIHSCYRWEGTIHEDPEVLLIIKSLGSLVPAIEALLKELHPYQVPELVAVPVVAGSDAYLHWLQECVKEPES